MKAILLGNESLARHQIRFALDNHLEAIASISESPKIKNVKIEEILNDLESVQSSTISKENL